MNNTDVKITTVPTPPNIHVPHIEEMYRGICMLIIVHTYVCSDTGYIFYTRERGYRFMLSAVVLQMWSEVKHLHL